MGYLQKVNVVQFRQAKLLEAQNEEMTTGFNDIREVMTTKKSELSRASKRSVCILGTSFKQY